jgi:Holliday junction resolvase RusA-like endonuclease
MRLKFPILTLLNEQLNIARGNKQAAAAAKKELTTAIRARCSQIGALPGVKMDGKIWVGFEWHYWNDSIDPIDNLPASLKPTLDAMVKEKIIKDDSSKVIQFPIFHTRTKSKDHTVTINLFENYEDFKQWIIQTL